MSTNSDAAPRRARKPIPEGPYDLAIVGAGINGAAIARDAVLRGHSVCLLDKGDIGEGTSSRTSKMLHGGMRYLESLRLGLVFESLRERGIQLQRAPHLCRPQTFVIPVYAGGRRGLRMIRIGIWLYDLLALGRRLGKGRVLKLDGTLQRVPGLGKDGLLGSGLYFDGVMDDARICLANVLDARASAPANQFQLRTYTELRMIRDTAPVELEVFDGILGSSHSIFADRVVRCVGPWTDDPAGDGSERRLLSPSKGVHLVLPALPELVGTEEVPHPDRSDPPPCGLLLTHSQDGRVFFVIPWKDKTIVGTTETPFPGPPDDLRVEENEVRYLLAELNRVFPGRNFQGKDVLATFAGVRPLARAGFGRLSLGTVSRKHRIVETGSKVFTVVGGKYTNYRAVAQQVCDRLLTGGTCSTRRRPLHGGDQGDWGKFVSGVGKRYLVDYDEALVRRLFHRYGSRLGEVLRCLEDDPALCHPLGPDIPEMKAEVVHGVLHEEVLYPADFLVRRTDLRYRAGNGREVYDEIESLIRTHGGDAVPPPEELDRARKTYFADLAWEDSLRQVEL